MKAHTFLSLHSPAGHPFLAHRGRRHTSLGVALLLLFPCLAAAQRRFDPVEMPRTPIAFVPNRGQTVATDRFTAEFGGATVSLRSSGATISLSKEKHAPAADAVSLTLLGANPDPALTGQDLLRTRNNFFLTGDPKSWATNVPSYARVEYSAVYKGIDLAFYGNESRLEYDFAVAPGGDTRKIAMALDGATRTHISERGDLLVVTRGGQSLRLLKPVAYQVSTDSRRREPVTAAYRLLAGPRATLKFEIGAYDRARPLVIDPVLVYGEVLSGNINYANAMTTDAQDNLYLANSSGVMKIDTTGTPVFTATLPNYPDIFAIAVDKAGNIYLTGRSGPNLPTTANAFQQTSFSTQYSPFLAVFNSQGTALTYCSYLGGIGSDDRAFAVAVDGKSAAYISGVTRSPDFPTTPGAYQKQLLPQSSSAAFLAKFDPTKSGSASLVYSTELGGAYANQGASAVLAVDGAGDAYIALEGDHTYPVTLGAYQNPGGSGDLATYISKVNPTGSGLMYSARLGPGLPSSIAVDGSGSAYVTGTVGSAGFPTTAGAYQTAYGGAFLSKLSSDGARLAFSTLLGDASGSSFTPTSMALPAGCAANCSALIAGATEQSDLPQVAPLQAAPPALYHIAAFLIQVNAAGSGVSLSSYFGGSQSNILPGSPGNESAAYIAIPGVSLDSAGNIYVALNLSTVYGGANEPRTQPLPPIPGNGYIAKIAPAAGGLAILSPASLAFTDTAAGTSNANKASVRLENTGSGTLHLFPPFQLNSPDFTEVDNCPAALTSGESCLLTLIFNPFAAGQDNATLSILSDAVDSPVAVQLSGLGIEPAPLAPIFSLSSSQFSSNILYFAPQSLVITDLVPNAVIHYTLDGTTPTAASPVYISPLTLIGTPTVKAIAIDAGVTSPVTTQTYTIYSSNPLISFRNGIGPSDLVMNGATTDQNYHLQLTDGGPNEAHSAWYPTPMPVTAFTTDFTFQLLNAAADGFTFTVQSGGTKAVGKAGAGLGYQGIGQSVALKFDLHNNAGEGANSVGLFVNGTAPTVPANDLTPSGVNLHNGDVMQAHVVYDGATLRLTLTDTATQATSTSSYPVNIPGIVGANSAYVGFTAGTGATSATQDILTWIYVNDIGAASQTPSPTIYVVPGSSPTMIALADASPGAAIYYTTDGTTPTTASPRYSSPFVLPHNYEGVLAIAVPGTGNPSAVATEWYYQLLPWPQFAYGSNSLPANVIQSYGGYNGAYVIDGRLLMTDLRQFEANSAWFYQPVPVNSFTTEFTFQLLQAAADGFTFTLQSLGPVVSALGKDGGGLGYQGIPHSVAVKFDLNNNAGEGTNSVGLYLNGVAPTVPAQSLSASTINLHSGHVMRARLTYDGKTLTLTLTDPQTQATASFPYAVDIPGTLGSSTATIGFTASTGAKSAIQQILSWSFAP